MPTVHFNYYGNESVIQLVIYVMLPIQMCMSMVRQRSEEWKREGETSFLCWFAMFIQLSFKMVTHNLLTALRLVNN